MFRRVTIACSDVEASRRFYDTVLPALEAADRRDFALEPGPPVTRRLHIGFAAPSRAHVDSFWRAGVEAGYRDDGEPGPRPRYSPDYYGGFLLDPDGNSAEAVHHGSLRAGGIVDHLWIRVADVDAAQAFYEDVGARAGFSFRRRGSDPDRAQFTFAAGTGSFSVVSGPPTQNAQVAFRAERSESLRDPDGNRVELGG